jgi:hypothetical protein
VRRLGFATVLLSACAFGDLFQAAGEGAVAFVWNGDSVVTVDATIPFRVTLLVDGIPAATPLVRVAIPDTTKISFASTRDSIRGLRPGYGDVVAWIESSLAARVDTVFRVHARP